MADCTILPTTIFKQELTQNGKFNPETGDRNLNRNIAGIHQITQKQVFKLPNPLTNTPGKFKTRFPV